jgi:hypothetical protein
MKLAWLRVVKARKSIARIQQRSPITLASSSAPQTALGKIWAMAFVTHTVSTAWLAKTKPRIVHFAGSEPISTSAHQVAHGNSWEMASVTSAATRSLSATMTVVIVI